MPCGYWELNPGPLQEQKLLLTAESILRIRFLSKLFWLQIHHRSKHNLSSNLLKSSADLWAQWGLLGFDPKCSPPHPIYSNVGNRWKRPRRVQSKAADTRDWFPWLFSQPHFQKVGAGSDLPWSRSPLGEEPHFCKTVKSHYSSATVQQFPKKPLVWRPPWGGSHPPPLCSALTPTASQNSGYREDKIQLTR